MVPEMFKRADEIGFRGVHPRDLIDEDNLPTRDSFCGEQFLEAVKCLKPILWGAKVRAAGIP